MNSAPTVALWLDTRSVNRDGKSPLKLRIIYQRKNKLYNLKTFMNQAVFMTASEYDTIILKRHKTKFQQFNKLIVEIQDIVKTIDPFSFTAFEECFIKSEDKVSDDLIDLFLDTINGFKNEQVSSKDTYINAIKKLCEYKFGKDELVLKKNRDNVYYKTTNKAFKITDVNRAFLEQFHTSVTDNNIKKSTASIYLRNLRAIYNKAIRMGIVGKETYPFITINNRPLITIEKKAEKTVLSVGQIKEIIELDLVNQNDIFARDFWLLSFFCYGMNMTDLLHLKMGDFYNNNKYFQFTRKKTSAKVNEKINVMLIPLAEQIINKYKTGTNTNDFVFNYLEGYETPEKIKAKEKWIVKKINRGMSNISGKLGKKPIKTYDCRYTFANLSRNKNVPYNFTQYAMGHKADKSITDTYMIAYNDEEIEQYTKIIYSDFTQYSLI